MSCVGLALAGKGDLQPQLDNALQDVSDMYLLLEETEKQAVRKALIEERGRFCTFIAYLQPVVVCGCLLCPHKTNLCGVVVFKLASFSSLSRIRANSDVNSLVNL